MIIIIMIRIIISNEFHMVKFMPRLKDPLSIYIYIYREREREKELDR